MKHMSERRFISWMIYLMVVAITVLAFAYRASAVPNVCPEEGKVESQVDGDLDDIVLPAGTEVCIKGGQTLVNVTADGTLSLAELLGTGQNVSHYTEVTPSTTTTTTSIPTTTTTSVETTTTAPPTTTTSEVETTTTTEESTTTTTPAASSSTEEDSTTTTVTTPPPTSTSETELPFTGAPSLVGLSALATALLGGGLALLRRERE